MLVPTCRSSVVLLLFLTAPLQASTDDAALTGAPIERFHRVDERLYRAAQPDAAGFRYLRDLGIRTVINLREETDAARLDEQRIVESFGMRYVHLPVADSNFFTRSRTIPEETSASSSARSTPIADLYSCTAGAAPTVPGRS